MADKLIPVDLPPGLYRNGTTYQSKGRWFDANGVRFIEKSIRPVGGWRRAPSDTGDNIANLSGIPRAALTWRDNTGAVFLAVGTTSKLYVIAGGVLYDISPTGLTVGLDDTTVPGTGSAGASTYGTGFYGSGLYGVGSPLGVRNEADGWQLDTFGNYLAAVATSTKKLYIWDGVVSDLAAIPAGAPSIVTGVVCTPERFLVALGADGNVRKVKWPSQETTTDWVATAINTAGDFELATSGALVCGARTRRDTLLFTDVDLHTMSYVGGELIYRFDKAGDGCGIVSPHAFVVTDAAALWMSRKGFFSYDGYVKKIPCEVHDYVFSDFNTTQIKKVWAIHNAQYGEVRWYYPSGASLECDRYVTFNYIENHWTTGSLIRTAGVDAGAAEFPLQLSAQGELFEHEVGQDRQTVKGRVSEDGTERVSESGVSRATEGIEIFLESGPSEIGEGDNVVSVLRIVPDEHTSGDVEALFYAQNHPMSEEVERGPFTLAEDTKTRFTARQLRVRLSEVRAADWRVGIMRLAVTLAGRR